MKSDNRLFLLSEKLSSIYSAQHQLLEVLPLLAAAASFPTLKEMFARNFAETQAQTVRLEELAELLGITLSRKKLGIMEEVLYEGKQVVEEASLTALNNAVISLARKAKSIELRAYGKAQKLAEDLGFENAAKVLEGALLEEYQADEALAKAAETEIESDAETLDSALSLEARRAFGASLERLLSLPENSGGRSCNRYGKG